MSSTTVRPRAARWGALALVIGVLAGIAPIAASANGSGVQLHEFANTNEKGLAIRTLRLAHAGDQNGVLISTFEHWNPVSGESVPYLIKRSTDDGATWETIAEIEDGETGANHPYPTKWTPTLLELPTQVGQYEEGTIFMVGAVTGATVQFQLWRSEDHGYTWTYGGVIQQSSPSGAPIWEPFLALGPNNEIVVYFSDERDPAHSQKLSQIVSYDGGDTWGPSTEIVAAPQQFLRPGMPIVAKLPDGRYVLSYELVGAPIAADAMIKFSDDGINWGDPTDPGVRPQTSDHRYLASYPYIAWSPGAGPDGQLLLTAGYSIDDRAPIQTPEQRQSVLVSYDLGETWQRMHLPFKPEECDGTLWGASLLPSPDGHELQLASPGGRPGSVQCGVFEGQANVGTLPYAADFGTGEDPGWVRYSGTWSAASGVLVQTGTGAKDLAGSTAWSDYTVAADVRVDAAGGTAGVVLRATDPALGANAQDAYTATVTAGGQLTLQVTHHDGTSTVLGQAAVTGGVQTGAWYRVTATAIGDVLTASVRSVGAASLAAEVRATDSTWTAGNLGVTTNGAAAFDNVAASTVSGEFCDRTVTGSHTGKLEIGAGTTCIVDAKISGAITIQAGAAVSIRNSTLAGSLKADQAVAIALCDSEVTGPVTIKNTTGTVTIGDTRVDCGGNTITGPVRVEHNATDSGAVIGGNRITGLLGCTGNTTMPSNGSQINTGTGPRTGQCEGF